MNLQLLLLDSMVLIHQGWALVLTAWLRFKDAVASLCSSNTANDCLMDDCDYLDAFFDIKEEKPCCRLLCASGIKMSLPTTETAAMTGEILRHVHLTQFQYQP